MARKHEPAGFGFLLELTLCQRYRVFILSRITGRSLIDGKVAEHTISALVISTVETMTIMSLTECGRDRVDYRT